MRLAALLLIVFPATSLAQSSASTVRCPSEQAKTFADSIRLHKLLRENGAGALIREILRPQREHWNDIKASLLRPGGFNFYSERLRGAVIPELNGTVVSHAGSEIVLSISAPGTAEVVLKLDSPFIENLWPGTIVLFTGFVSDFHQQPFRLVFAVERKDISLLPDLAAAK